MPRAQTAALDAECEAIGRENMGVAPLRSDLIRQLCVEGLTRRAKARN
jgi:hypothetical protein